MTLKSALTTFRKAVVRKGAWHWVRFGILLVIAYFVGHYLQNSPRLTDLRYWMYRVQTHLQHGAPDYPRQTAVVTIEDADFWGPEFAGRTPLRRDLLADLLLKLKDAEVNTVVLDVDLRLPNSTPPAVDFINYAAEDKRLLDAMKAMCAAGHTLVLSASVRGQKPPYQKVQSIYSDAIAGRPQDFSCVQQGYIQLPADLRYVPGQISLGNGGSLDSLSLAAVKQINPKAYNTAVNHPDRGFRYARYLSESEFGKPGDNLFRFSWGQVNGADVNTLRKLLANKVVLIGGAWSSYALGQGKEVDLYNSPMGPMAGVFVHANYIEALDGERGTFAPVSDLTVEILEFSLAVALALIGALEIHAAWKWGAFAASLAISIVLTYVLLENLGVFLDFLVPMFILIGHTLVEEFLAMRHELHRLRHFKAEGPA